MTSEAPCGCLNIAAAERDRYASFIGLDCNGQASRLVDMLRPYMEQPEYNNAFWQHFAKKLAPENGPKHDALFLIHAHINILREQLEAIVDEQALLLLDQIEHECC